MLKNKSLVAFFVCCTFLLSSTFYISKWDGWGSQAEISWDLSGYYMYLPGTFYDQLSQLYNRQHIIDTYHPCGDDFYAYRVSTGKYVIKYSSGMAFMYLPGFAIGHVWAKLGGYPVDGFSRPYQISMTLYSLFVSFVGLWFIRKLLLLYFEDFTVACALIVICFATNYLNYSAAVPMFSHNYLFTVYSIIIYLCTFWYTKPDYKKTIVLGILCGLAALIRPNEVICVFIPIAWGLGNWNAVKARWNLFLAHWPKIVVFVFLAISVGSIQLLYWKKMTGHYIYWSYGPEEGFNFIRVHVHDCFFGYKKGWLVYTPVMVLSVIGLIPLYLRKRTVFWPVTIFAFFALYIVFAWKTWWYGGSFSQRAVIQYYPVLLFPMSAFFEWVKNNRLARTIVILFCAFCIYLNLVMTYQANISGVMECNDMTRDYFWAIFGRPQVPMERRKLLETDIDMPVRLTTSLKTIYVSDTAMLTTPGRDTILESKKLLVLDKNRHDAPEAVVAIPDSASGWYRLHTYISVRKWTHEKGKRPQLHVSLYDAKGNELATNSYSPLRIINDNDVADIFIDIKVPDGQHAKTLKGGIMNYDNENMLWVGKLWVEHTKGN